MATTITETGGRYPPGTVLSGRYRTVSLIGTGGMGEVYLADDLVLGEPVALKFLPVDAAAEPELLERFLTEVRLARKVTHPNVARVHDIAEADGRTFLSMEYVDGEDLHKLLRRIGRLPAEKAVEISKQICEGLHAAHDRGVLHRDLKPANIMLDGNGRVRITDFGLAELAREHTAGRVVGTPAYMSPEQITGGEVSVRSDIYSLGLVLYEIFTGKRAFEGASFADFQRLQVHETPTSPSTVLEQVDPAVEAIILRCIEKDPGARPSSARAVTLALPGGDPLAAALASGDTPAPELVAAAGSHEVAPLRVVNGLMAAWIVLLATLLALAPSDRERRLQRPNEKPPAVLEDRIHTLLGQLGYRTPPAETAAWYENDQRFVEAHERAAKTRADSRSPDAGADIDESNGATAPAGDSGAEARVGEAVPEVTLPSPLVLRYRQSPRSFNPAGPVISLDDPAPTLPGMVTLSVDSAGRLMAFDVVPGGPDGPGAGAEQAAVDDAMWQQLFDAAGLLRAELESIPADFLPAVHTSERHAWRVPAVNGIEMRVTAAGLGGRPVHFRLAPAVEEPTGRGESAGEMITMQLLLLGGALLAWRNVRSGRSDRKGAWRVAIFGFVTHLVQWLGMGSTPGSAAAWFRSFVWGLGYDFVIGFSMFVFYLALEPFVRRRWPTALISWSRLLTGRLVDPLVGRDVLVGGAAGLAITVLYAGFVRVLEVSGLEGPPPTAPDLSGMESAWGTLAAAIHSVGDAVMISLLWLLILVLLRTVARFSWLALVIWLLPPVALALASDADGLVYRCGANVTFFLIFWALATRFGLLACCVAAYVTQLATYLDRTLDTGSWNFHTTVVKLLVLAALGGWAFRSALAGRPLLIDRR